MPNITTNHAITYTNLAYRVELGRLPLIISAPLRSTTWIGKPFGWFSLFRPSTAEITIRYTTTSITFKYMVDKQEQRWATVHHERILS